MRTRLAACGGRREATSNGKEPAAGAVVAGDGCGLATVGGERWRGGDRNGFRAQIT